MIWFFFDINNLRVSLGCGEEGAACPSPGWIDSRIDSALRHLSHGAIIAAEKKQPELK